MDMRQAFFDNLLMLDFDPVTMSSKHYVTFSKDMFAMPNHRAFQFVTYFLFQRLDKAAADEAFRHCWPIGDKRAEAEFRKVSTNWLAELASSSENDELPMPLPRIVPSLFMSPGGDKFYYLMFAFSRLVLARISVREYGIKPHQLIKPPVFGALSKDSPITLQTFLSLSHAMVIAERTQFVQELKQLQTEQKKWSEAADRFVATYRSALRGDKGAEESLKAELEAAAQDGARLAGIGQWSRRFYSSSLNTGTPGSSAASGRMAQRTIAERVRKDWRRIEEMWTTGQTVIQLIGDCLADRGGPNGESTLRVDGSQITVRLPDLLVHRLEEMALSVIQDQDEDDEENGDESSPSKINQIKPIEMYDRGRLNLVALIRFATSALSLYSEQFAAIVGAGGDYDSIAKSLIEKLPEDTRFLRQMVAQLRENRKGAIQVGSEFKKKVRGILSDTIYCLPATVSSLSRASGANNNLEVPATQTADNDEKELSPSFFVAAKPHLLQDAAITPANVSGFCGNKRGGKKQAISPDMLEISDGPPHDFELVPMTPLVSAATLMKAKQLENAACDENDDNDLLIDLHD